MTPLRLGDARGTPGGWGTRLQHSAAKGPHLSPPSPTVPPIPGPAQSQRGSLGWVPSLARDPWAGALNDALEEVKVTRGNEGKERTDSLRPGQASGTDRKVMDLNSSQRRDNYSALNFGGRVKSTKETKNKKRTESKKGNAAAMTVYVECNRSDKNVNGTVTARTATCRGQRTRVRTGRHVSQGQEVSETDTRTHDVVLEEEQKDNTTEKGK